MMTLDEAIKHCEEVAMNLKEKGFEANVKANNATDFGEKCYKCAEDHRQLAEWLKELKAYKYNESNGGIVEALMHSEAENERLHDELKAYKEKETCETCGHHKAYQHGADITTMNDECGGCCSWNSKWIPNTCGDAISRQAVIEALNTWDKFGYAPTNELVPLRGNVNKDKYVPYIRYDDVLTCIRNMPSVTPQEPTTNDSGADTVSRKELLKIYEDRFCELQKLKHLRDNKGAEDRQLGINYCINILKEMPSVTSQLCSDAISRQAALDCLTASGLKKNLILFLTQETKS